MKSAMKPGGSVHDPRNLIGDAISMHGLSVEQHRSIFLDWAFGLERPEEAPAAAAALLARWRGEAPADHPMLGLLAEAAAGPAERGRRGGRRRRLP